MRASAKLGSGIKELFIEVSKEILGMSQISIRDTFRTTRGLSLVPSIKEKSKKRKKCCK